MPARKKTKSNTTQPDQLYRLFARNLKRLRQEVGLKMYAAADALGVAKSTWCQWECGKRFPTGDMLAAIADYFEVEPCALLKGESCRCEMAVHKE